MVNTASALLAAGDKPTALRALIYLSTIQQSDGSFPQNFWINGQSHWGGHQLDEVAFPVLLAWRLYQENALQGFDPHHLIKTAAAYLVRKGPATAEERWEDSSGYSPSTTAVSVAALICAASFLRSRGEEVTAIFLEEYGRMRR